MFKKLKEKLRHDEQLPAGPSTGHQQPQTQTQTQLHPSNPFYIPPPPQIQEQQQYNFTGQENYQPPPPRPPPNQGSSSYDPPPYHDWTVIPDTSLLPPPPSIGYETSPTANATMKEGERALAWTNSNPLWQPQNLTSAMHAAIRNGQLALLKSPTYMGDLAPQRRLGHWKCKTKAGCKDTSILTNLPLYSVVWDSPLRTQMKTTIYFELKVTGIGRGKASLEEADAGIAIGYVAPPYPTFRLPGWQRGSLGIHGDDGRKYVNDTWGGVDFTTAFKPGETVGIGITFSPPKNPPSYEQSLQEQLLDIDIFFTRDGKKAGGWDGNLELDQRSEGGTVGLRGECDLFPAIGVFGGLDFEVFFNSEDWKFNPY